MKGKVYIVGAGPGDPGLITLKGLAVLQRADVVLYDRLVSPRLLRQAAPSARRTFVGKRPQGQSMSQEQINSLMLENAREGLLVVRLKGGDPLLFGRGGEEADFLARSGVDFEIVPGVTAAAGAAAFAGIPLTDRRLSSVVALVTAREGQGGSPGVDWGALARLGGTIAVYMGRANMPEVVARLVEAGHDNATPAAVVECATLPSQRTVTGTLADICRRADEAGIQAPCITIIGAPAAKYPSLAWFENLPLFGKSVLITRPRHQQEALAAAFEALGAEVIRFPTIEIVPAPTDHLQQAVGLLPQADWVVFTSANGVSIFFDALKSLGKDARALGGKRVAAIGPATGRALASCGVVPDLVPSAYSGAALLDELLGASGPAERFLLWRAAGARRELADGLGKAGRGAIEVTAYRAVSPTTVDPDMVQRLKSAPPSAILFSSASTGVNFAGMMGDAEFVQLAAKTKVVSIGPVTSEALRELGVTPDAEADPHTGPGLLEATAAALGVAEVPSWVRAMFEG
ncbi:MAG: uroporphyrinogen-III C-methyltransferase [Planctomycetota bacterium]|jgi:uroporphyrinogen III methyltransferase/synthase